MNLDQWIGLIVIVISLYVLWQIKEVILLIFAAVVLATTLNRLSRHFQRFGLKRGFSVLLSVSLFFAIIVGFFWLVVPPFADQFQELTRQFPEGLARFDNWLEELKLQVPRALSPYMPDINSLIQQAEPWLKRVAGSSVAFVSGSLEVVLKILLVMVLTGMFLAEPLAYRKVFVRLFPSFYRRRLDGILDRCEVSLEGWVIGAIMAMFIVGGMSFFGLWILGVSAALALGVLAGFLNLIPNLGPTLSVIPAMAIAFSPDSPWRSLAVLILYFVIQQVESNFLTPIVMAHQVSLLPAVTLISQLFFAYFFGFLGLFLALPLTVVGRIWLEEMLVKDVLDAWSDKSNLETKFVIVSEENQKYEEEQEELNEGVME